MIINHTCWRVKTAPIIYFRQKTTRCQDKAVQLHKTSAISGTEPYKKPPRVLRGGKADTFK
jgi:hypothetical protein